MSRTMSMEVTEWDSVEAPVMTRKGMVRYSVWCNREAERMCKAGAKAWMCTHGTGLKARCCVMRTDNPLWLVQ